MNHRRHQLRFYFWVRITVLEDKSIAVLLCLRVIQPYGFFLWPEVDDQWLEASSCQSYEELHYKNHLWVELLTSAVFALFHLHLLKVFGFRRVFNVLVLSYRESACLLGVSRGHTPTQPSRPSCSNSETLPRLSSICLHQVSTQIDYLLTPEATQPPALGLLWVISFSSLCFGGCICRVLP